MDLFLSLNLNPYSYRSGTALGNELNRCKLELVR